MEPEPGGVPSADRAFRCRSIAGNEGLVVVEFAEICDRRRSEHDEQELLDLVSRHTHIACDMRATRVLTSDWIRWLVRMTIRARDTGRVLGIVGLAEHLKRSSDLLGALGELALFSSIEEVWSK